MAQAEGPPTQLATPAPDPATDPPDPAPEPGPATVPAPDNGPEFIEVFPHVRIDRGRALVEFDGYIAINAHHPQTPIVWLEQIVCTPDSMEHESIVMSSAVPSDIHAALLLVGAEPGRPGEWVLDGNTISPVPPRGSPLRIRLVTTSEGADQESDPCEWVVRVGTDATLCESLSADAKLSWVFGGSLIRAYQGREVYEADMTGTLVGLCTFGTEVVSPGGMYHHQSSIEEPVWVARNERIPPQFTPVRVRIQVLQD